MPGLPVPAGAIGAGAQRRERGLVAGETATQPTGLVLTAVPQVGGDPTEGGLVMGGGLGPEREATDEEVVDLMNDGVLLVGDPRPAYSTNAFFFSLEGLFSLHFLNAGNFTLWVAMDYHTDGWRWNASDNDCRFAGGCMPGGDIQADPMDMGRLDSRQRQVRLRLGGSLEFILSANWNMWASFEGILAGKARRIYGDVWGFGHNDVQLYGRLGFTYKFGYVEREQDPIPVTEPVAVAF